jgi:hypothetical protein
MGMYACKKHTLMLCRLLHGLAATPAAAWAAAGQGGTVYALSVLLPTAPPLEASRVCTLCSHEWQAPFCG